MDFVKLHGLGNDYVYVDCRAQPVANPGEVARAVSDRRRGVGSDGLILVCPSARADVRMEMYNADGSRAQMCGNGIRCLAKLVYEREIVPRRLMRVETDAGVLGVEVFDTQGRVDRVRVDMGRPSLNPRRLPCTLEADRIVGWPLELGGRSWQVTCISVGNPHAVTFVDDLADLDLAAIGPQFENAPMFPERINAHFARAEADDRVAIRTWERGSGATQACGTGACAVCVAGVLAGRTGRRIQACLPGGVLDIVWSVEDDHLHMTGPAVEVFTGRWPD